jgi:dipeptidase E
LNHEQFPKNSLANIEKIAASIKFPSCVIDDQTAIKVIDDKIEVVSEGNGKLLNG